MHVYTCRRPLLEERLFGIASLSPVFFGPEFNRWLFPARMSLEVDPLIQATGLDRKSK